METLTDETQKTTSYICNGYIYYKSTGRHGKQYLTCAIKTCWARGIYIGNNFHTPLPHNHPRQDREISIKRLRHDLRIAVAQSSKPLMAIYNDVCSRHSGAAQFVTYESVQTLMTRARKRASEFKNVDPAVIKAKNVATSLYITGQPAGPPNTSVSQSDPAVKKAKRVDTSPSITGQPAVPPNTSVSQSVKSADNRGDKNPDPVVKPASAVSNQENSADSSSDKKADPSVTNKPDSAVCYQTPTVKRLGCPKFLPKTSKTGVAVSNQCYVVTMPQDLKKTDSPLSTVTKKEVVDKPKAPKIYRLIKVVQPPHSAQGKEKAASNTKASPRDQPSGNNVSAVSPNDNKANSSENILDPERKEQDNILNVEQNSIDTNIFNFEKESTTLDASSINLQSSDNQITAFNSDQEDFMGFETDDNENITPNKSADHQEELLGINIKDFESLKTVVRKLEVLSEKLSESTKTDSFDQFGKYVTSLLRGLPKHKALLLKQKIVSDILDAILDNNQPSSKAPLSNNINNATTMAATNKIYPNHQVNSICDDRLLINTSAQHINKDKAIHSRGKLLTKSNDQPSTLKLNILPYPENPSVQTHITSSDISSTKGNNKNLFNCFPSIRSTKQDSSQVFKRASTTIGPNQCSSSTSFCIESTDSLQCNSRSTSSEVYESNSSSGVQHFSPSEAVLTPTRKKRPKKRKLSVPKSLDKDTVYQASSSIKMENVGETCDIPSDHRCFEIVMCDGPGTLEIKEEPLEIIDQLHSDCTKSQEFECALCSACFQSKDLLILHFRQHHEGCIPSIKQDR